MLLWCELGTLAPLYMTGLKNEHWFTFIFSNNRTKSNTNIFNGNFNSHFLWLGQKDVGLL